MLQALLQSPLFAGLRPEEVQIALGYFIPRRYRKGQVIFKEGDLGQALYLVEEGLVRLYRTHLGGQERTLGFLAPGEGFGEMSLLDEAPRSASAEMLEEGRLLLLFREEYQSLLGRLPRFGHNLALLLVERLRAANLLMDLLVFEEVEVRVAFALWLAHRKTGQDLLPLSHAQVAGLAGSSRESATRALHALRKRGVLTLERGAVRILNPRLLEEIAHGLL
ncbi:MAG: Crp/Fnr family transcriptional regulator [Thermus sp.]|uniref:Crp/Fnr family transcriptional regulator n=1 Tax=Thermus sp. TaxID=275 RepID=UPI0033178EA8